MQNKEKNLQYKIGSFLQKHFHVYYEVWSECRNKRIDILAIHRQTKQDFVIEVKVNEKKRGKDLANWLKQASEYNKYNWKLNNDIYTNSIVLIAPQITCDYLNEGDKMSKHKDNSLKQYNNVNTFLGQFGIGELMKLSRYNQSKKQHELTICFVYSGQIIYEFSSNIIDFDTIKRVCK